MDWRLPANSAMPGAHRGKSSVIDVEKEHLRSALGKHVGPRHEQAVLGAALEVEARAAGTGPNRDMGDCGIAVGVDLLEYVDRAGPGRINPPSRGIEPQIVDTEHARKAGDNRAG